MKTVIAFSFLIFSFSGKGQNLVVNGDFELYDQCPTLIGSVNGYLQSAYNPHLEATTDYYNSCDIQPDPCIDYGHVGVPLNSFGNQEAYNGSGYIGLYVFDGNYNNYREYIILPLSNTLTKDSMYNISFSVSRAETIGLATDAIMIGFSFDYLPIESLGYAPLPISGYKMADSPVIDNKNWTILKKHYKANGTENYLIIGNFLADNETTVVQNSFQPFICSPSSYVGYANSCYYYIDGVNVSQHYSVDFFPNVFTPNEDGINDRFSCLIAGYSALNTQILNRWGEIVYETTSPEINWDGRFKGNICSEGVYFYKIFLKDDQSTEIIMKQGSVTLVK